jgi:hypothetical protein
VQGTAPAILRVLAETGTGRGLNTAYIERLNATFRGALAPLARRSRRLWVRPAQVTPGQGTEVRARFPLD